MKTFLSILITVFTLSTAYAAETEYNVLPQEGGIKALANISKAGVLFGIGMVQSQILEDVKGSAELSNSKMCLRIGMLFTSILESAVRYGRHAKDPSEVERAKGTFISGMKISTICEPNKMKIVNPEYAKAVAGDDVFSHVIVIKTIDELQTELSNILELNKVRS